MKDKYLASQVNTSQGSYRIIVGKSILSELGKELDIANLKDKKCFLIADKAMFPKNIKIIHEALESHDYITNSFSTEFYLRPKFGVLKKNLKIKKKKF